MRLEAKKPITARGHELGGKTPLVCIPLVGKDHDSIMAEAGNVPTIAPDVIELRIDWWDFIEDVEKSAAMIREVRKAVGDTPIILTCRGDWEGGYKKVSDKAKFAVYAAAVREELVDFVDMELKYGQQKIDEVKSQMAGKKVSLIVSFHNFQQTPSKDEMFSIMEREIKAGADVAKLAAMPKSEEDVLTVLAATLAVRRKYPNTPIISMSMGPLGAVTRIVGGLFGSDLTFAVGSQASAPGQIPVGELRKCFEVVHQN
jgi:3-dehydroquinate dehydratase-1